MFYDVFMITAVKIEIGCPVLKRMFPVCAQIHPSLQLANEEPEKKIVIVDADLGGEALPHLLRHLSVLQNEFGWKVLLHPSLQDCEYTHKLGLTNFINYDNISGSDSHAHLLITDGDKRSFPLFVGDFRVDIRDCEISAEVFKDLEMILNHGQLFLDNDPRLQPVPKNRLRTETTPGRYI